VFPSWVQVDRGTFKEENSSQGTGRKHERMSRNSQSILWNLLLLYSIGHSKKIAGITSGSHGKL
jgi:hypothetical protein